MHRWVNERGTHVDIEAVCSERPDMFTLKDYLLKTSE
jgi:hypothetical protein